MERHSLAANTLDAVSRAAGESYLESLAKSAQIVREFITFEQISDAMQTQQEEALSEI